VDVGVSVSVGVGVGVGAGVEVTLVDVGDCEEGTALGALVDEVTVLVAG